MPIVCTYSGAPAHTNVTLSARAWVSRSPRTHMHARVCLSVGAVSFAVSLETFAHFFIASCGIFFQHLCLLSASVLCTRYEHVCRQANVFATGFMWKIYIWKTNANVAGERGEAREREREMGEEIIRIETANAHCTLHIIWKPSKRIQRNVILLSTMCMCSVV